MPPRPPRSAPEEHTLLLSTTCHGVREEEIEEIEREIRRVLGA